MDPAFLNPLYLTLYMTVTKVSVKERVDCNIHLTERRIKGVESCQGPTPGVCFTEVSESRLYSSVWTKWSTNGASPKSLVTQASSIAKPRTLGTENLS